MENDRLVEKKLARFWLPFFARNDNSLQEKKCIKKGTNHLKAKW